MNNENALLIVEKVSKVFGKAVVLQDVSLHLSRGEILGLLGPNGSGKTTLLKIAMGFLNPDRGKVRVLGKDPALNPSVRREMGYVPEEVVLYDSLTVREFLYFMARMRKLDPKRYIEKIKLLLTLFGMEGKIDQLIGSLSKGDRQKVAIISAVMHDPLILILDEPLLGLDPIAARVFKEFLFEMKHRRRAILISTHILELAELLCDRICILHKGRIVAEGSVSEIMESKKEGRLEDVFLEVTGKDKEVSNLIKILREEL